MSPLGLTLANLFLAHMETKLLDSCVCRPKLYAQFVNDCFPVFDNGSSLDFLSLLNF